MTEQSKSSKGHKFDPKDWEPNVSAPFTLKTMDLSHHHVIEMLESAFYIMRMHANLISQRLPRFAEEEKAREASNMMKEKVEKVISNIQARKDQIMKVLEVQGIELADFDFTDPKKVEVKMFGPWCFQLMRIFSSYDELLRAVDTAWFNGQVDDVQRKRAAYEIRSEIRRLSFQLKTLHIRSDRAARAFQDDRREAKAAEATARATKRASKDGIVVKAVPTSDDQASNGGTPPPKESVASTDDSEAEAASAAVA